MGGTGRQAENQGDEIPRDSAKKAGEYHFFIDHLDVDQALGNRFRDGGAKPERGNEIKEGGPENRAERCEYARGDDGGDGIGGVVPAVREFERESDKYNDEEKGKAGHRLIKRSSG